MFKERAEGKGIIFTNNHTAGQKLKDTIEDGDNIILHIEGEQVLVKNVTLQSNNNYSGVVYGFEPSFSLEFNGLKIEDEVNFSSEYVISCSSK